MALDGSRVVSNRFPYIPVRVRIHDRTTDLEALLDTGFDGDIIVLEELITDDVLPDGRLTWYLADDSEVVAPAFRGAVRIGQIELSRVVVTVLGSEAIVGSNLIRHFTVILDHGRQVIVEP